MVMLRIIVLYFIPFWPILLWKILIYVYVSDLIRSKKANRMKRIINNYHAENKELIYHQREKVFNNTNNWIVIVFATINRVISWTKCCITTLVFGLTFVSAWQLWSNAWRIFFSFLWHRYSSDKIELTCIGKVRVNIVWQIQIWLNKKNWISQC